MTLQDIRSCIDSFAPFATQEKWDNSGLLVGDPRGQITGVLVSLDVSPAAVARASETGCNAIVAHHPIIFQPIRTLTAESVPYQLAAKGIGAVCCHTPLDIAPGGINDLLADRLRTVLPCAEGSDLLEPDGCGRILTLTQEMYTADIAAAAKRVLGCTSVRFGGDTTHPVKRLGICSGAGSSMLEGCAGDCDCLLTGDVKHDRWYAAQSLRMGLIDCGHYHTEVIAVPYLAERLRSAFPGLSVTEFVEGDPVQYV